MKHTWFAVASMASLLLWPQLTQAQSLIVKVPEAVPQGPNPVAPQSKLVVKKATFGGVERTWYEYVPALYTGTQSVPLVVAVHGGNADGIWMYGATSWAQIADQQGFIVIYPNGSIGTDNKLRWNAYEKFNTNPGMAISSDNGVDEAAFLKELMEATARNYKIDLGRVYMHGQSNGGMMTSYFGLRFPAMLAAMAVASAPPSIEVMATYSAPARLPTYFWGGETDTVAGQYNPANKSRAVLCREFAEFWTHNNHSAALPQLRLDGPYNTLIYSGDAEVRSTEFRSGVHTLPFTAAYVIWNEFFSRFARGKNEGVIRLTPDLAQAGPPDSGAIAIKLGAPFALVNGTVVRLGKTPDAAPVMLPGAPSSGAVVPVEFAAAAFGGTINFQGDAEARITTQAGTATFTVGSNQLSWNGKLVTLDVATTRVGSGVTGDVMISLTGIAGRVMGKTISTRKDVYRNDIYYISDRATDLSAQTISYIDQKLTAGRQ
jgi:poly(3-hydroxybutyrate) depolymerase